MADRIIGDRIINWLYPATGPPICLHGQGVERLDWRATAGRALAAYPGKPLQTGGSRTDAGNGTLEPVAVSIDPQYGTVGPFRTPGATGARWSALLDCECGTVPCVAGPEGKRHA